MIINCFSKDQGWLFEDLKDQFKKIQNVVVSNDPILEADTWLCIRTNEAYESPSIENTIVQVHDCYDYDIDFYNNAKLIIFTHPVQYYLWQKKGYCGKYKIIPIGTRSSVDAVDCLPRKFTLGFFCKETEAFEKRSNLFGEVVDAVKNKIDIDILMIGDKLEHISHLGEYNVRSAGIDDYQRIDALFTSSISPAVPLSVYETLATGKPVITTPRWFPFSSDLIYYGNTVEELSDCVKCVYNNRNAIHSKRNFSKIKLFTLENWIQENIDACYE